MKSAKKVLAFALSAALMVGVCTGCGQTQKITSDSSTTSSDGSSSSKGNSGTVKNFSTFFAVPAAQAETSESSDAKKKITEITGANAKETWLTGQTASEAVGMLIAGGEYPDFLEGSTATAQLLKAGAFVNLDSYIDKYPNIKKYFTTLQWAQIRQAEGGHIYYIP